MYKIPIEFNIDKLKGEVITQIAFGLNFITLFFNQGIIQFSGTFTIHFRHRKIYYQEVYPVINDFGLLKLIEKSIVGVEVNDYRNILTLIFEDEIKLQLTGNDNYESFRVKINDKEIIV